MVKLPFGWVKLVIVFIIHVLDYPNAYIAYKLNREVYWIYVGCGEGAGK